MHERIGRYRASGFEEVRNILLPTVVVVEYLLDTTVQRHNPLSMAGIADVIRLKAVLKNVSKYCPSAIRFQLAIYYPVQ